MRGKSLLETLKDRIAERLGEVLYRLYVQELDPFSATEVVEDADQK